MENILCFPQSYKLVLEIISKLIPTYISKLLIYDHLFIFSASDILEKSTFLKDWDAIHPNPWVPSEDHLYLKEPFIKAHPSKLLQNGTLNRMPILIGHTIGDGK